MRKIVIAAAMGACVLTAVATAEGPIELQPEARAYLNLSFDGHRAHQAALRYGLRIDQDLRYREAALPPMAQLEFDPAGFDHASFNGVPFVQRLVLNQDDSGSGGDTGEGGGKHYSAMDWGLIAIGVIGVGAAVAEVANGKNSPDVPAGSSTGGSTGSSTGGGGTTGTGLCLPPPLPQLPGCTFTGGGAGSLPGERADEAAWLDGGTGQMGDLVAR